MSLVNDYLKRLGNKKSVSSVKQAGGVVPPVLQNASTDDSPNTIKRRKYLHFAGITIAVYAVAYSTVSVVTAFQFPDDKDGISQRVSFVNDTPERSSMEDGVQAEKTGINKHTSQPIVKEAHGEQVKLVKNTEPQLVAKVSPVSEERDFIGGGEQSNKIKTTDHKEEKKITLKDTTVATNDIELQNPSPVKNVLAESNAAGGSKSYEEPYPIVGIEMYGTATSKNVSIEVVPGKNVLFKESSNTPTYYYQIALQAQHDNNFRRAERYYLNTLREDPRHENAIVNLAAIYIKGKRFQEAQSLIEEALALNPKNSKALVNAGMIALEKNEKEKASDYFHKALGYNPSEETALINLAYLELQINNYDKASVYYEKLIWVSPENINILLAYAGLEEKREKYNSAINLYMQCLDQLSTRKRLGQYDKIIERIQVLKKFMSQQNYNNYFQVNGSLNQ